MTDTPGYIMTFGPPSSNSPWADIADVFFFRAIGVGIIFHETVLTENSEWELIVAGICMFLMPDVLRGQNSLAAKILNKVLGK